MPVTQLQHSIYLFKKQNTTVNMMARGLWYNMHFHY